MKNILRINIGKSRIYGLDILRALAIIFVLIGHGNLLLPPSIKKWISLIVFDGVTIFFVLSGFLIGGILIKILEKEKSSLEVLFNFWVRRWLRTIPIYFLILTILLIINNLIFSNQKDIEAIRYFTFTQNLFDVHPFFFPEAWSLSVEEWFYLLIPSLIFASIYLFNWSVSKSVLFTAILVILGVTFYRFYKYQTYEISNLDDWDFILRKQVFTRLDSLIYGVIGAYLSYYYKEHWFNLRYRFLVLGLILFLVSRINAITKFVDISFYFSIFSFTITSLATLLIIPFLTTINTGKGWLYKSVTYISLTSYSMYLINLSLVQSCIIKVIDWKDIIGDNIYLTLSIKYSLYWLLTVTLSILLYKYFELPIMNLRNKIKI